MAKCLYKLSNVDVFYYWRRFADLCRIISPVKLCGSTSILFAFNSHLEYSEFPSPKTISVYLQGIRCEVIADTIKFKTKA